MDLNCVSEPIDLKFLAGLLSVLVALSAYIGNVRRELIKRCSSLRDNIHKETDDQEKRRLEKNVEERERDIALLVLADAPLILGATLVFIEVLRRFFPSPHPFLVNAGLFLAAIAVACMAVQHGVEWNKSIAKVRKHPDRSKRWLFPALLVFLGLIAASLVAACLVTRPCSQKEAQPVAKSLSELTADVGALQAETARLKEGLQTRDNNLTTIASSIAINQAAVNGLMTLAGSIKAQLEANSHSRPLQLQADPLLCCPDAQFRGKSKRCRHPAHAESCAHDPAR